MHPTPVLGMPCSQLHKPLSSSPQYTAHSQASHLGLCRRCLVAWNACLATSSPGYSLVITLDVASSRKPFSNPILQWEKLRHKEVSYKGQAYAVCKHQSQRSNLAWFYSRTLCFLSYQLCPPTWPMPAGRSLCSWIVLESRKHGGKLQEKRLSNSRVGGISNTFTASQLCDLG